MKLIPRNDLENNVVAYYLKEEALAKTLKRIQNRAAKGMLSKIGNILSAAGYKGADDPTVMLRPADPRTIRELERIADGLPDTPRRNMLSKLYGQIGTGNLTVKRAIRDVLEFDTYSHSIELYDRSKDHLRRVTEEAMLRGEYAVQKGVGIGWQVDAPGLKEVDRFLDKRWTQNKATEFLKPMSQIVQDQVSQGLLLGEHPSKIAERIKNVEPISDVRAKRMARTTVTAVSNEAHAEQFEKHGIKRYEFRAMFNERTCIECGRLDGKIFNMDDKQPGVNFPPIHPNCRCTTAAALSKEAKERLRETAIKNGHKLPLRDQMTFEEWKKQQGAIANMGANVPIGPVYEATPEVKAEAQKLVDKGIVGKMELDSTYTVKDVQRIGSELESIQKTYGVPPPASITTHMSRGNEGAASEYKFGTDAIAVNTRDRFKATHSRMMGGYERAKKELKKGQPFYPRATAIDNLEDMIAHEEAHHLHDLASRAVGKDIRLGEAYGTEVLGEFRTANIDGANRIVWKDAEQEVKGKKLALSVSKYASTNPVDLFAEAFVLYRKDANSIPKELREVIEGAIRLAGGKKDG